METLNAISQRRSIRKFSNREIPLEIMKKILNAGIQAPSPKNRQPWKFIVVTNKEKPAMIKAMQDGISHEKEHNGLLQNSLNFIAGAENSLRIMEQASITVFVLNTHENYLCHDTSIENRLYDIANIQAIGASIENMLLAATELGIGSLWICDVFFAYREILQWLNEQNQLVAAISFGYPEENPYPRPRSEFDDIVEWR